MSFQIMSRPQRNEFNLGSQIKSKSWRAETEIQIQRRANKQSSAGPLSQDKPATQVVQPYSSSQNMMCSWIMTILSIFGVVLKSGLVKIVIIHLMIYDDVFLVHQQVYQTTSSLHTIIDADERWIYIVKALDMDLYNGKHVQRIMRVFVLYVAYLWQMCLVLLFLVSAF